jgi:chemotaxis protein CheD
MLANVQESKRDDGYFDENLGVNIVSVMAGAYRWSRASDVALCTTLGSCLSVCAYDRISGIGGMNHFLLPQPPKNEKVQFSQSFRYGSAAIETMLNALYKYGAAKNGLVVKIFGGAKVLAGVSQDVGQRNITFAHNFFKRENMRIESEDVGGKYGRRIIFFPQTGKVLLRSIGDMKGLETILDKEAKILQKIHNDKREDEIELF